MAILNFSLGARPQNDFVVAGLANAYFIKGHCLQDLHRSAEAKKAIAQAVALSPNVLPESRNPSVSLTPARGQAANNANVEAKERRSNHRRDLGIVWTGPLVFDSRELA